MKHPVYEDAICITLDVDWAPEAVLAHVVRDLRRAKVSATFFATHDSPVLRGLPPEMEVALHPNLEASWPDHGPAIEALKSAYPAAIGARSHALITSSRILQAYVRAGIQYEANQFLLFHEGLRPAPRTAELLSIPGYWSDDNPLCARPPFNASSLALGAHGLKVYNFHPIHIYMNTKGPEHYAAFRPYYKDPAGLEPFRNTGRGAGTLFETLLEGIARGNLATLTLREVHEAWAARARGAAAEVLS